MRSISSKYSFYDATRLLHPSFGSAPEVKMANNIPPECQELAGNVEALEQERNDLQEELRQAAPGQKRRWWRKSER